MRFSHCFMRLNKHKPHTHTQPHRQKARTHVQTHMHFMICRKKDEEKASERERATWTLIRSLASTGLQNKHCGMFSVCTHCVYVLWGVLTFPTCVSSVPSSTNTLTQSLPHEHIAVTYAHYSTQRGQQLRHRP